MTWLCALRYSTLAVIYAGSVFLVTAIAYGLGMRRATKKHWQMLNRAGSKVSRDGF